MSKSPYHVYAPDGFESAHRTEAAAIRAAKRGAKRRHIIYQVVACDAYGLTGSGHGYIVARVNSDGEVVS